MATVTGARGTTLIGSDQRVHNMDGAIKLLQPDAAPFTTLLMQLKKTATKDPKFLVSEDALEPRFDAVNGTTGTGTSVVVDNGAYFAQHDLVLVTRTGEIMRVTAVTTNTLTVVRGVGGSAIALADNDELLLAGSAQPEGDTSKPARSSNPTSVTGYTQIFRRPWELTNTAIASDNDTTPHDWDQQAAKVGIEHKRDIERAFLFGKASEDTSGSQARRTTDGILNRITTNATDAGGTLTETEFLGALRQGFRYGGRRKVLMVSPLVASVLNAYAAGKVQVSQSEKSYGVDVTTFTSPFGAVRLIVNWELEGAKYGGYAIGIDFDAVEQKVLKNAKLDRDTKVRTNIQAPDADTRKDEYLTETGLLVANQEKHFVITNVTG